MESRVRSVWASFMVVGVIVVGCGPVASPGPAEPGTTIKTGGTFRLAWDDDPYDWDVTYAGIAGGPDGLSLAHSQILRFKTGEGIGYDEITLEPGLAERWEASGDARTFTFSLRKGARFADLPPVSGREISSADVKWSYEYSSRSGAFKDAKLPPSDNNWAFEGLDRVETPDPHTVVVRFAEGFSPFLTYAATRANPIMPKEIYEQHGNFKDNLLGAGPFQLDTQASQKGNRWVFKKNTNYWEPGKPYLDEVRFVILKDYSTVRAAYQTGQLDSHYVRNFRDAEEIRASVPDSVVYEFPSPPFKLWLSLSRPPTSDFRVRKAISLALDRDGFVQTLAGGKGGWALGLSDALSKLFSQEEIKAFIKQDTNEARRLLAEAGYPGGVDVEVIGTGENAENMAQIELLQAQLRRGGINAVLKPVSSAEASTRRRQKDFEIITGVGARTRPDMDATLMSSLHPKGSNNYQGVDDPKATELVFAQRRETDPAKRREIIRQVVRHVNETFIYVPTFRRTYYTYYRPYVRDYYPHIDSETRGGPGIAATWLDR